MLDTIKRKMQLILNVDDTAFKKDLHGVEANVKGFTTRISSVFSKALLISGVAGAAGTLMGVLSGKSAIEAAQHYGSLRRALENVYRDAAVADQKLEQFKRQALDLPAGIEEIVRLDVALNRFGLSTEKWLPLLVEWREATKILGTDLESLTFALARLTQGGAGAQRAFMTILQSGVTKKELAEYGVMFNEETGKLLSSSEQTFAGIERLIKEKFGGSIERAQNTFGDAVQDMKDLWTEFMALIGKPVANALKKDIRELANWFVEMKNNGKLEQWANNIASAFIQVYDWAEKLGKKLLEIAQWLYEEVKWFDKNVAPLEDVFIVAVFATATVKVFELMKALEGLMALIGGSAILRGALALGGLGGAAAGISATGIGAALVGVAAAGYLGYRYSGIDQFRGGGEEMARVKNPVVPLMSYDATGRSVDTSKYTMNISPEDFAAMVDQFKAMKGKIGGGGGTGGVEYTEAEVKAIEAMKFAWEGYYDFRMTMIQKELDALGFSEETKAKYRDLQIAALDAEKQKYFDYNGTLEKYFENNEMISDIKEENLELAAREQDMIEGLAQLSDWEAEKRLENERKKQDAQRKTYEVASRFMALQQKSNEAFIAGDISLLQMWRNAAVNVYAAVLQEWLDKKAQEWALQAAAYAIQLDPRAIPMAALAASAGAASVAVGAALERNNSIPTGSSSIGIGDYDSAGNSRAITQQGTTIRGQSQNITIAPVISISGDTILIGNMSVEELRATIGEMAVKSVKDALVTGEIAIA